MQAQVLVKNGNSQQAFELRELPDPQPLDHEVLIDVEAFGLNYADVMARLGIYQDCPPLPAIIGYEVVGRVAGLGKDVTGFTKGQRVVAMTRFGGYATQAVSDQRAVTVIPDDMDAGAATALATQYNTAYYAAEELVDLNPGDHILIHAAAGGVGTALIQLAKRHDCVIFGTAGSAEKLDYLRELGVHYPINYREVDFAQEVERLGFKKKLDVVFDPVGGNSIKKGIGLLTSGGRIVCYGASSMSDVNLFQKIGIAWGFGIWSPIYLMMNSLSIIGLNMLRIADNRPEIIKRCLTNVTDLVAKGELQPVVGGEFSADKIAEAHDFLASRKSIGKVVVKW